MKRYAFVFYLFIIFAAIAAGCKKHECQKPKNDLTEAIITGNDAREGACVGGLMITFENNAQPYATPFFNIDQLPPNSGITEKSSFPIFVRVKYEKAATKCGTYLNITKLERR